MSMSISHVHSPQMPAHLICIHACPSSRKPPVYPDDLGQNRTRAAPKGQPWRLLLAYSLPGWADNTIITPPPNKLQLGTGPFRPRAVGEGHRRIYRGIYNDDPASSKVMQRQIWNAFLSLVVGYAATYPVLPPPARTVQCVPTVR